MAMIEARVFRQATAADRPACAAILNAYVEATDWLRRLIPVKEIAGMFSTFFLERRPVLVPEVKGKVAGYHSLDMQAQILHALYLAPEHRTKGVGDALPDSAKSVWSRGPELTVEQPNILAKTFDPREGLRQTGLGADEAGLPVFRMKWADRL